MAEEIEIEIGPNGKVTVTPHGIKGKECTHLAELFATIVGKEEERQYTSEYYEIEQGLRNTQNVKQHRR